VCKTFSKFGALAAARLYLDNDSVSRVIYLDTQYQKYKNDIAFYENSIKKTNNVTKKQILETRIEVSHAHLTQAALQLEKIIF
jgi:predicted Zn-dependent peptidase